MKLIFEIVETRVPAGSQISVKTHSFGVVTPREEAYTIAIAKAAREAMAQLEKSYALGSVVEDSFTIKHHNLPGE